MEGKNKTINDRIRVQFDMPRDKDGKVIPGRAKQEFKDECNIQNILDLHRGGYEITHLNKGQARWGDFSNAISFKEASDAVFATKRAFDELPSKVRKKFANDPGELFKFLDDEKNRGEAIELGLVEPPVVEPEIAVEKAVEPAPKPQSEG